MITNDVSEDRQSLWALTIPPGIWAIHFLTAYAAGAVWCGQAGRFAPLGLGGVLFAGFTALALSAIAMSGRNAWHRYQHGEAVPTHHQDSPGDRHRFLGLATALLAMLSLVAVLYSAFAVVVLRNCS